MLNSAIAALLWSSTVEDDTPADEYEPAPGLINRLSKDLDVFVESLPDDFDPADHWVGMSPTPGWDAWDQLGHDYILTRNHHGAGFWDGDWEKPMAEHLTKASQALPELYCWLNGENQVEVE